MSEEEQFNWTVSSKGASNSSTAFVELCDAVERLIRDDAHMLIAGGVHETARLIMAHLAHKHGLELGAAAEARGYRKAIEALRGQAAEFEASNSPVSARDCRLAAEWLEARVGGLSAEPRQRLSAADYLESLASPKGDGDA
jgi:hypothetical protein